MILLSAGHYPGKPGACFEGFCEFDEAERWIKEVKSHLSDEEALLVPPGTLKTKVAFINARHPALAVEIHFNSAVNARGEHVGDGSLCLYYPGSKVGKQYAERLQYCVEPVFGKSWDGVMEGWYRMDKKYGPDFFLAKTNCPAVIVEPQYIHRKENIIEYREAACFNIAEMLKTVGVSHVS